MIEWLAEVLEERERRLEDLYEELADAKTPAFSDLVVRRERLEARIEGLENKFDRQEEALDLSRKQGKLFLFRLPKEVGAAIAINTTVFIMERRRNHLAAVYGRRIKRTIRAMERSLR